ncbi:acetyltransferase, CysE/LacA/LpxA/NodL family [Desulfobacca acetoxidans DSM 11109]|uniref:Chloramphenicol acetyltransferase n=2 Tax=Desulfobacca acetoxidans TaxID=60893 RepID=F2NDG1_DESAR|nr:acetyltransferase, CysE/LacA/LpxA/NodL family [Desulfobacca acetoxidans DSM 11109]
MRMFTEIFNRLYTNYLRTLGAQIGRNTSISYKTDILQAYRVTIGSRCIIYKEVSIYIGPRGSLRMGDQSHLAPYSYLLIENNILRLGNKVAVGPFCGFFCHSNYFSEPGIPFCDSYVDGNILIGSNIFIGAQCIILPDTHIEDNVIVGANSLVKGTLENGHLYAGIPVKKIKRII